MDAREALKSDNILSLLAERRADLASAEERSSDERSAGLLDLLNVIQQTETGTGAGQDAKFDDDFIVDNVRAVQHGILPPQRQLCPRDGAMSVALYAVLSSCGK